MDQPPEDWSTRLFSLTWPAAARSTHWRLVQVSSFHSFARLLRDAYGLKVEHEGATVKIRVISVTKNCRAIVLRFIGQNICPEMGGQ